MSEPSFQSKPVDPVDQNLVDQLKAATIERRSALNSSTEKRENAAGLLEITATLLHNEILVANLSNPLVRTVSEFVETEPEKHYELFQPQSTPDAGTVVPEGLGPLVITPQGIQIKIFPPAFTLAERAEKLAESAVAAGRSTFFTSIAPNIERVVGPLSGLGIFLNAPAEKTPQKTPDYVFRSTSVTDLRYFPKSFEEVVNAIRAKCEKAGGTS